MNRRPGFARGFLSISLRAKIILGILLTGGIALGVLSFIALNSTGIMVNSISQRLETSVKLLAEEQLINTISAEAERADQYFEGIMTEVSNLADYRVSLQPQQGSLGQGMYWNAATSLIQLSGGQYGNSAGEIAAVFVPAGVQVDAALLADLNTSAYLDFSIPEFLNKNTGLLAIYYIDTNGTVRRYPNNQLSTIVNPDFDSTKLPFFEITSPLFNPQRLTRWAFPYFDDANNSLISTVTSPVYIGDDFKGVVAADVKLAQITEQISSIKVGQTGYAFMLDDAGRIISMPPGGYAMYGVDPNALPRNEFFKQTVLGVGPGDIKAVTARMVAGGNGLNILNVNGIDAYITYERIKANGYSMAIVVPVAEMQGAILTARQETQNQIQSAIRTALIILIALLAAAIIVSLGLGQIIAAPVRRLTDVATQITNGDLSATATAGTSDEIGTLASAFNIMTARLRETLEGLEHKVEERTAELEISNQKSERRAKQFETIARMAHSINSTRNLDTLLAQIPEMIHREFGFYHIGIFLLDMTGEFAVLSSSNSAGGRKMLERGHRLKVGETGMVGYVTSTGRPRIALNTGTDAVFFNNPDLPETHSELSLPLKVGDEIIGALDVQSEQTNAFNDEDIQILGTLADQIGVAIQNARQHEATQRALAESESLARQFIQAEWSRFTQTRKLEGIRHSGAKSTLLYSKPGNGAGKRDSTDYQPRLKGRGGVLSLPVKLRGEVIGTVDVHSPDNRQWDQDELDIVTAIIDRSAIALENARLLYESQKRAAKEHTISDITTKISAQSEIDQLLKTAAQELGRTLPGMQVAIQFKKEGSE